MPIEDGVSVFPKPIPFDRFPKRVEPTAEGSLSAGSIREILSRSERPLGEKRRFHEIGAIILGAEWNGCSRPPQNVSR